MTALERLAEAKGKKKALLETIKKYRRSQGWE